MFHMKQLILVLLLVLLAGCRPTEAEMQATAAVVAAGQTALAGATAEVQTVESAAIEDTRLAREQAIESAMKATAQAALDAATATAVADPCSADKFYTYGKLIERELEIYEGLLEIAGSTSRVALAGPRQEMLAQRFVVKDIEAPECLQGYHAQVLTMMEQQELGYEMFMLYTSDTGEVLAGYTLFRADQDLYALKRDLKVILDGRMPSRYYENDSNTTD